MKWIERIVGVVIALTGLAIATPKEMLLVYLHRDPMRIVHEARLDAWEVQLIGLILIASGLALIWRSLWTRRLRR